MIYIVLLLRLLYLTLSREELQNLTDKLTLAIHPPKYYLNKISIGIDL